MKVVCQYKRSGECTVDSEIGSVCDHNGVHEHLGTYCDEGRCSGPSRGRGDTIRCRCVPLTKEELLKYVL